VALPMPRFDYRAQDAKKEAVEGVVEADTRDFAMQALVDRGYTVLSLTEQGEGSVFDFEIPFFNKIAIAEIVVFSRQFAVLMGAKVPVVKALKTVARQTTGKRLATILVDIASDVESGTPLSSALAAHPTAFSEFFVNMVRSGETTGRLEEVMNYLADQMERDFDLNNKIKGAMTYPIFVIFGLVVVGFVMMTFVIPKLTATLTESGAELPWTTKGLIAVSSFFKAYAIQIIVLAIGGGIGFRYWTGTPDGRRTWDQVSLSIPIFGPIQQRIYLVRMTRSISTLISGGVDIPRSLEISADVVGNAFYADLIRQTRAQVGDGASVTAVLSQYPDQVPSMIVQMMSVGEETGRLGEVLERLTGFYERDLQNKVANLVSAIEPLIMLVMGLAVGIMVAAIMLPMYNLATQF